MELVEGVVGSGNPDGVIDLVDESDLFDDGCMGDFHFTIHEPAAATWGGSLSMVVPHLLKECDPHIGAARQRNFNVIIENDTPIFV